MSTVEQVRVGCRREACDGLLPNLVSLCVMRRKILDQNICRQREV